MPRASSPSEPSPFAWAYFKTGGGSVWYIVQVVFQYSGALHIALLCAEVSVGFIFPDFGFSGVVVVGLNFNFPYVVLVVLKG